MNPRYPVGTRLIANYNKRTYFIAKKDGMFAFKNDLGELNAWENEEDFFERIAQSFKVVGKPVKQTLREQVKDLTEQLAAKDAAIKNIKESCENQVQHVKYVSERSAEIMAERDKYYTRMADAERRAGELSSSVSNLKAALKYATDAVKA